MIVFLIGYRATGKTTIGRELARRLGFHWMDSDREIEKARNSTVADIIRSQGEPRFRIIERTVIQEITSSALSSQESAVISLGGGAVLDESTRQLLSRNVCVWLKAPADILVSRIESSQDSTPRPALTTLPLPDEVKALLEQREPVYSDCADCDIDTGHLTVEQAVERITQWLAQVDTQ